MKNARFWKLKRKGNGGYGEAQAWPALPLLRTRESENFGRVMKFKLKMEKG